MTYSSKRPFWQWLVFYLLIGGVIYALIYYFVIAKNSNYNTNPQTIYPQQKTTFLTDPKGMSLYIFDKDTLGVSNCIGTCLAVWPAYLANNPPSSLPTNYTVIKRSDGSMQYAWKGLPLYYYIKDKQPGDVLGDGINGIWHLVKP